jgi:hypothetical protein
MQTGRLESEGHRIVAESLEPKESIPSKVITEPGRLFSLFSESFDILFDFREWDALCLVIWRLKHLFNVTRLGPLPVFSASSALLCLSVCLLVMLPLSFLYEPQSLYIDSI